jgi:hypothetical protein
MSILDDAIREHLELKRAHGADEGELQKLEDEAFGPPQRPDEIDPFAEAPTEFLVSPGEGAAAGPAVADEHARGGRRANITDLQEAPPPDAAPGPSPADPAQMPPPAPDDELSPPPDAPPPSPADAAGVPLPPPPAEAGDVPSPPAETGAADAGEITGGPNTEERHAIADQPTQMFDVQAELQAAAEASAADASVELPVADDEAAAPAEQASPSDEELVDAAQDEPHAAPPAPEDPAGPPTELYQQPPFETRGPDAEVAGHPPTEEESAEFDFFNEQRLADELDQALEAPITDERALPGYEDVPPGQGAIFDIEGEPGAYEEDPSEEVLRRHDAPAAPAPEPPSEEAPHAAAEPPSEEHDIDYDPDTGHDDVLEDTPRFLEDQPEDDDLWFEQKPPKDFDLD